MLSHVFIGIKDFGRAKAFYDAVMTELGFVLKFEEPERQWAGWIKPGVARPLFLVGVPFDGQPAQAGNGQMIALLAPTEGRSTALMRSHWRQVRLMKAAPDSGRSIIRIITAPTSATPMATSSASAVTIQRRPTRQRSDAARFVTA